MKQAIPSLLCLALLLVGPAISLADDALHGGDIHYEQPVKGVLFSHAYHVEEMGFDCESCHDDLFVMESLAAQNDVNFNMQGLYDGLYCGACHDGETAFAANTRCASCHEGVKGHNRALGVPDSETSHH